MTPAVSVVVAVRDAQETIAACLDSLLALDHPSYEIIVVDNASRDATASVLARYGEAIRVLAEARRGPAAARNTGIEAAGAPVVAFTDADCVADPHWLSALVAALDGRSDRIAGGRILATRPCNRVEAYGERTHDHRAAIERHRPPYAITMNWAMPRPLAARPFDEALLRGSDVDLSWRLGAEGWSFAYAGDAVIFHRNERTLRGLFGEGVTHGRAGERVRAKHGLPSPRLVPRRIPRSLCEAAFEGGKLAGRLSRWSRGGP